MHPTYARLCHKYLQRKWRGNRCTYCIDIDWSEIHFNRVAIVNLLLSQKASGNYLEIGCAENYLFDSVLAKNKTGVDPERGGTHKLTSDEFFQRGVSEKYDVIFIDGLHVYDQVRRDLVNSLRCLAKDGWVALHDMYPRNWKEEHVPRLAGAWTGDVWKVAFELAQSPEIDFRIIKIDCGVGVLRKLKEDAQIIDLSTTLRTKRFPYFYENVASLPIVDHNAGREWIQLNLTRSDGA
jgi:hypothetical protein